MGSGKTTFLRTLNNLEGVNKKYFKEIPTINSDYVSNGDIVINMKMYPNGSRKVSSISEISIFKNEEILVNSIFEYDYESNSFIKRKSDVLHKI